MSESLFNKVIGLQTFAQDQPVLQALNVIKKETQAQVVPQHHAKF